MKKITYLLMFVLFTTIVSASISYDVGTPVAYANLTVDNFWINVTSTEPLDYCFANMAPSPNITLGYSNYYFFNDSFIKTQNGTYAQPTSGFDITVSWNSTNGIRSLGTDTEHRFLYTMNETSYDHIDWQMARSIIKFNLAAAQGKQLSGDAILGWVHEDNLSDCVDSFVVEVYHNASVITESGSCTPLQNGIDNCWEFFNHSELVCRVDLVDYIMYDEFNRREDVQWASCNVTKQVQESIDLGMSTVQFGFKIANDTAYRNGSCDKGSPIGFSMADDWPTVYNIYPRLRLFFEQDWINMTTTANESGWRMLGLKNDSYEYSVCCGWSGGYECTDSRVVSYGNIYTPPLTPPTPETPSECTQVSTSLLNFISMIPLVIVALFGVTIASLVMMFKSGKINISMDQLRIAVTVIIIAGFVIIIGIAVVSNIAAIGC